MDHPAGNGSALINIISGYTSKKSIIVPYHRFGHCAFRDGDGVKDFLGKHKAGSDGASGDEDFGHGYCRGVLGPRLPAQEKTQQCADTKAQDRRERRDDYARRLHKKTRHRTRESFKQKARPLRQARGGGAQRGSGKEIVEINRHIHCGLLYNRTGERNPGSEKRLNFLPSPPKLAARSDIKQLIGGHEKPRPTFVKKGYTTTRG